MKIKQKGEVMSSKRITDIPGLMYLWKYDNLYLAGQPAMESFPSIRDLGVKKIYNLRGASEMDFLGEERACKDLGMDYENLPIVENGSLSSEACDKLSQKIEASSEDIHFIHCGSANRVAGWLMTYLTNYKGISMDDAIEIAENSGLSNPGFIEQAEALKK